MKQIGHKIIRLESVDSTNNYVANLNKTGDLVHGAVIMAVEQFAGRGQRSAEWVVKPGENLTFSCFLSDVNVSVLNQFCLTQFVSIVLIATLKKYEIDAEIKWPNDIYVNGKKIAGVLIENQIGQTQIKTSIVGIGLNVNQKDFGDLSATSIVNETGTHTILDDVLFRFISEWNKSLDFLRDLNSLRDSYESRLYLKGISAQFLVLDEIFKGVIEGVTESGLLKVTSNHENYQFDLKEITFLPQNDSLSSKTCN
jgi:BirA family biotin operon repressor/biotin-[acetyl-CoA-carboxylase] ligase